MPYNYLLESHKEGFPFPDPDRSPGEKNDHWYILNTLKAMYSAHSREKTAITPTMQDKFVENRLFGKGNQPDSYYRKILINDVNENVMGVKGGRDLAEQRRKSWQQLDFKHKVSYAPKVEDHFWSLYQDSEKDVVGHMIDKDSGQEMKTQKLKMLAELKFHDQLAKFRKAIGEDEPNWDFFPMDKAELDLFEAAGGFKLNYAKAMEKLLKQAFEMSEWGNLGRQFSNDVLHTGYIMGQVSEHHDTNETVADYCDPEYTIVQHSNYWDFRDIEYVGILKPRTLNSLRKYIKKEELIDAVKQFYGVMGNPGWGRMTNLSHETDINDIGHYKVLVMEGYFIDYEDHRKKEYINPYKKKRLIDVAYDYEPRNNNEKIRTTRKRFVYTGKWVVGSEILFDYGKANDQLKDGKEVRLPFKIFKVADKPITERLIPIYHQMEIGWLKFQNAQAQASASGHAINMRLLSNVEVNEEAIHPLEALKFMKETGDLIYSDTDLTTAEGYKGGETKPVQPIEGGMRNDLEEGMAKFEWAIRMVEYLTGLSGPSMGQQATEQAKVANTQLAAQGSYSIIRPHVDSIMALKGALAKEMMFDAQLKIRDYKEIYDYYAGVIGEKGVEAIKIATKRGARSGIHFEPRPSKEQKQRLFQLIEYSLTAGRNGTPLLQPDEAWAVEQELMSGGNIKEIGLKLSYKIRKREEEENLRQRQFEQQRHENTVAQNEQKIRGEMAKDQQNNQAELQKEQLKQQSETRRTQMEKQYDLQELRMRIREDIEEMVSNERIKYADLVKGEKDK
ncbi:MAG: hypothetical protein ACOCTU_05830 [Bacteroidota bacterium]